MMAKSSAEPAERTGLRRVMAVALLLAALGIVVQLVAGVDYPPVPPGLVIIVVAAALVVLIARLWAAAVAAVIAAFVLVGGIFANTGWGDLTGDADAGSRVGLAVELVGLVAAVIVGAVVVLPSLPGRRSDVGGQR